MDERDDEDRKALLTVEEAAKRLSLSRSKVYQLVQSGELRSVTFSPRLTRIPPDVLDEFVRARTR